jgi:hypothetical protein
MNTTIFDAIITRLNGDATLMSLMGKTVGDNPCYRAQRLSAITPPAVTLHANTESSDMFPGSNYAISAPLTGAIIATNKATIQVDIWVSSSSSTTPSTGLDTDAIGNQIDILLIWNSPGYTYYDSEGTKLFESHGWRRVSSSQQYEEDNGGLWHNALRYEFYYHILQGYGLT